MGLFSETIEKAARDALRDLMNIEISEVSVVLLPECQIVKAYRVTAGDDLGDYGPYVCEGEHAVVKTPEEAAMRFLREAAGLKLELKAPNEHSPRQMFIEERSRKLYYPVELSRLIKKGGVVSAYAYQEELDVLSSRRLIQSKYAELEMLENPPEKGAKTGIKILLFREEYGDLPNQVRLAMTNRGAYTSNTRLLLLNAKLSMAKPKDATLEYYHVDSKEKDGPFIVFSPGTLLDYEAWKAFYEKNHLYFP